jgi:hypothetical protein
MSFGFFAVVGHVYSLSTNTLVIKHIDNWFTGTWSDLRGLLYLRIVQPCIIAQKLVYFQGISATEVSYNILLTVHLLISFFPLLDTTLILQYSFRRNASF